MHKTESCYKTFWIDKQTKRIHDEFNESLNLREISAPSGSLKELQSRLCGLILSKLPKHPANFAYMSGRNIRNAAEAQVDGDVLIRIDLKDFFGKHYEPYVRSKLHELTGYSKELCWFITKLCSNKGALPQGAVTSPLLSIVLNMDMDNRIAEVAARHNMVYTRYADDLCFSGVDRDDRYIFDFIDEIVFAVHPFSINWNKVDIMRNRYKSFVCGVTVRNATEEQKTELQALGERLGMKVKCTSSKVSITKTKLVAGDELTSLKSSVAEVVGSVDNIVDKRFYMQSIKRMLGMHLTNGIKYPRAKYNQMRLEAMLVAKGADINMSKFRGKLAFMRMVEPARAEKIDAILNKFRRVN